jgi:hypothetical protein
MLSTRPVALRAAFMTLVCGATALALMLSTAAPATAAAKRSDSSPCANRLCTKDRPHTTKCWRLHGRAKTARCFIARAAAHYRQPRSQAFYIAHRESRYNWRITNPSSGTAGLFQFARGTWESTPYRNKSPYHPRWASLAAMWMWAHGGYSHWRL